MRAVVSLEQLGALAAQVPPEPPRPERRAGMGAEPFDLEQWLSEHGLQTRPAREWKGGRLYVFDVCPWNEAHTDRSAYVIQHASGALDAGCHHNGCQGKDWAALRELVEPGYRDRPSRNGRTPAAPIAPAAAEEPPSNGTASGAGSGQASAASEAAASQWEDPTPLFAHVLPPFPLGSLPGWLRAMVEATSEATQTPPDLAAMVSLAVLATAAQKRAEALVRAGWHEVLSLWAVVSLPPGNRKTSAYTPMVAPVVEYEEGLVRRMGAEVAAAATEYEVIEGALKRLKDQAIKAKNTFDRDDLTRQAAQMAEKLGCMKKPVSPRLMADDATPERLGMLLADHAGRMALIADEGDVFDMMAGKYASGAANIGIYLRGHSGSDLIVDRIGRPSIIVRRCAITLGLCVQPESLLGLTANATFKGRGLLGRFLYALPVSTLGDRNVRSRAIPPAVAAEYHAKIEACLDLPAGLDADGQPVPHLVPFSAEADDAVAAFEEWIEPELGPGGSMGYMADWGGKLAGQMVRMATLLHLADYAGVPQPWRFPVEAETLAGARQIAEYLIPHARAAFQAMGTDPTVNRAQELLQWLKKADLDRFSKREAFNALRNRFARAGELDEPLGVLLEHGYLRQIAEPKRPGPGQPPSPTFEVHPAVGRG